MAEIAVSPTKGACCPGDISPLTKDIHNSPATGETAELEAVVPDGISVCCGRRAVREAMSSGVSPQVVSPAMFANSANLNFVEFPSDSLLEPFAACPACCCCT